MCPSDNTIPDHPFLRNEGVLPSSLLSKPEKRASLIVVEDAALWPALSPRCQMVTARAFLEDESLGRGSSRVVNLCRSYRYQRIGYYVSLLAEARGFKPLPTLGTLQDIKHTTLSRSARAQVERLASRVWGKAARGDVHSLEVTFGQSDDAKAAGLARLLFRTFPAPFLVATFRYVPSSESWSLWRLSPELREVLPVARERVAEWLGAPRSPGAGPSSGRGATRFDLAILRDPRERESPSNERALKSFVRAGERLGLGVEMIGSSDLPRIPSFDALLIRQTTSVHHYTYRFAQAAKGAGLFVIDAPEDIVRCSNKVYQAELFRKHKVPIPQTWVLSKPKLGALLEQLPLPCVLKMPDSSFSAGVFKVSTRDELTERARQLLKTSELVVAQAFVPTPFDWRVGVMEGEVLFVCRYHMARSHWQIVQRDASGKKLRDGLFETLPVDSAPDDVKRTALAATSLIGNGLYGVDLKEVNGQAIVIEVNDNPNIDGGIEDHVLGDALYDRILEKFIARITALRGLPERA